MSTDHQFSEQQRSFLPAMMTVKVAHANERAVMRAAFIETTRPRFLYWLAKKFGDDLRAVGVSDYDIYMMRTENIMPEGFAIHHITPISLSGDNAFSNLVFMPRDEHSDLHTSLDKQINHAKPGDYLTLSLPQFSGPVKIPTRTRQPRGVSFVNKPAGDNPPRF